MLLEHLMDKCGAHKHHTCKIINPGMGTIWTCMCLVAPALPLTPRFAPLFSALAGFFAQFSAFSPVISTQLLIINKINN